MSPPASSERRVRRSAPEAGAQAIGYLRASYSRPLPPTNSAADCQLTCIDPINISACHRELRHKKLTEIHRSDQSATSPGADLDSRECGASTTTARLVTACSGLLEVFAAPTRCRLVMLTFPLCARLARMRHSSNLQRVGSREHLDRSGTVHPTRPVLSWLFPRPPEF
jgi:hypothetical protein